MSGMEPAIAMAMVTAVSTSIQQSKAKSARNAADARAQAIADRENHLLELKVTGEENIARADLARRKAAMRARHAAGGLSTGGSAEAVQSGLTKQSNRDMYQKRLTSGIHSSNIEHKLENAKYTNLLAENDVKNQTKAKYINMAKNYGSSAFQSLLED